MIVYVGVYVCVCVGGGGVWVCVCAWLVGGGHILVITEGGNFSVN